ncbi:MAG: lysozyme [Parvibaculaceae bacterium]
MRTGSRGLALIKQYEGLRLDAYRDTGGVLTIGWGHTAAAGPPRPTPGMRITLAEAEAVLARDLVRYETAVTRAVTREIGQNQFDAMVSLCFNIGGGAFAKSTVVRAFNAGDDRQAADAFLRWSKDDGRVLPGLLRRRRAERRLFLSRTSLAKWAIAGGGGVAAGEGMLSRLGEAALEGLGYRAADVMTWQVLAGIGVVAGALAMIALAAMGHDRRERLWNGLFGGWLS